MRYKPPSIKDEGLTNYLNRTKEIHNGFSARAFHVMVDNKVNVRNIARAMHVHRVTVTKWLKIDQEEKASAETAIDSLSNV